MNPGTLVSDNEFRFRDGQVGKKILVVLNDGEDGYYITLKMTSNPAYKANDYGCHPQDRYPNFFCPRGSCCLREDTWIQIDDFFEFDRAEMLSRHFAGRMQRIGVLPDEVLVLLLECAIA